MSQPTIKAVTESATSAAKPAPGGGKGAGAHAGEQISGGLYRGGTGEFQAGPAAQLQKRLEAIRAKRGAKGKGKKKAGGKGKGKAAAKPKLSPADKLAARKEKIAANRTAAIAAMANADAGLAPGGAANLLKLADGGGAEGAGADAQVKMGLAETGKDGKARLTAAGRSAAGALGRGDADGAIRAINKAGEGQAKKQERDTARQAKQAERAKGKQERAKRVKEKVSARAKQAKQPAKPAPEKEAAPPAPVEKAPSPAEKAKNRTAALDKMTDKPNDESLAALDKLASGGKADPDFAASLADETGLVEKGEDGNYTVSAEGKRLLDALDKGDAKGAASALADGQNKVSQPPPKKPAKPAQSIPTAPKRQTTKGIDMADYDAILDSLTAHSEALAELIDDDGAIKAGARHSGSDNKLIQAIYDSAEDICELSEALGATVADEATEPEDAGDMGESIGHEGTPVAGKAVEADTHVETIYGSEIKSADDGTIGGFAVLFGTDDTPDMSSQRDYFTKTTDYWLDHFGWPRPMTYHHGLDEDTRDDPIVGSWTKAVVKEEGIWLEGQLDRAHRYHGAIKELVKRGYLKLSSDSAPQWVIRQRQANGTNEVKRWPLISASPTVMPAEPRLAGISFKALIAELGIDDIHDNPEATDDQDRERQDAAKAAEDERTRRLLALNIELSLIELETTIV